MAGTGPPTFRSEVQRANHYINALPELLNVKIGESVPITGPSLLVILLALLKARSQ